MCFHYPGKVELTYNASNSFPLLYITLTVPPLTYIMSPPNKTEDATGASDDLSHNIEVKSKMDNDNTEYPGTLARSLIMTAVFLSIFLVTLVRTSHNPTLTYTTRGDLTK